MYFVSNFTLILMCLWLKETDGHTDGLPLVVLSAAVAAKKLKELALVYKRGKGVMGVITTSKLARGGGETSPRT